MAPFPYFYMLHIHFCIFAKIALENYEEFLKHNFLIFANIIFSFSIKIIFACSLKWLAKITKCFSKINTCYILVLPFLGALFTIYFCNFYAPAAHIMHLTVSSSFLISFVMRGSSASRIIKILYLPERSEQGD